MAYVDVVDEGDAQGAVAEMYDDDRGGVAAGQVPNYTKVFSARPAVYAGWQDLNGAIKSGMDLRRYELATFAAARRLRSTYCTVAHGNVLLAKDLVTRDTLAGAAADPASAPGLDDTDRAVMALAEKVAADATSVTQADVDELRALGLSDADVTDVVLAAAARCFFSKTLDALGAATDAAFADRLEDPELLAALTVGRPLESA
jgi:uncharacterized peroxidase-related enzyme